MRLAALVVLGGCESLFGVGDAIATDAAARDGDGPVGDAVPALPKLVQQMTATTTTASSLVVTLPAPATARNTLVMIGGTPGTITSVIGGGVTWQTGAFSGMSPTVHVWFGATDGTSATVHLMGGAVAPMWVVLTEWSGLAAAIDGTTGNGAASGPSTGPIDLAITTTQAPDLLVFAVSCYGAITAPTGSWTELTPAVASPITQRAWFTIANPAGAQAAHSTFTNDWDAALVAFRTK